MEVARQHPYDPHAYLNVNKVGWEMRLGNESPQRSRNAAAKD
jgi:galactonate dehydratase